MPSSENTDIASRVFNNRAFQAGWTVFLFIVILASWPIRDVLLVFWVYGTDAYFTQGIRVLPGKPIRFSDGKVAPVLPDMLTGFGMFFFTTFGLTLLLFFALRSYERRSTKHNAKN